MRFDLCDGSCGICVFELRDLPPKLHKSHIPLPDEFGRIYKEAMQETISTGKVRQGDVQVQACLVLSILGMVNFFKRRFRSNNPLSLDELDGKVYNLIFCDKSFHDKE